MTKEQFFSTVVDLPVWDTHTHLDTSEYLCAQSFWEIGHYFWYKRELEGVGYPLNAGALEEEARAAAFFEAFTRNRNTAWNRQVARGCKELFGVELTGTKSIRKISDAIQGRRDERAWTEKVCEKAAIRRIVVDAGTANQLDLLGETSVVVPSYSVGSIPDGGAAVKQKAERIREEIRDLATRGYRVLRVDLPFARPPYWKKPNLEDTESNTAAAAAHLGHTMLEELAEHRFHIQLFIGIERDVAGYVPRSGSHQAFAQNNQHYVSQLHPIFDQYGPDANGDGGCTFEILSGAEQSALDIVQAARIYRNVYPGGLWWFNFRASTYRANMQYRLEGLSALRSMLIASDARCIEWSYIKITYVKRLLADFLWKQIQDGWLDEELALYTAQSWLHDSAAERYSTPTP